MREQHTDNIKFLEGKSSFKYILHCIVSISLLCNSIRILTSHMSTSHACLAHICEDLPHTRQLGMES